MVRLKSISKAYSPAGPMVIDDFSLDIAEGERFILLGPSGCGKTTLLRMIAGFETPDRGGIFIAGENVVSLPVERRPVGFIFQNHALFGHMTVYDNIAVGPRVRGEDERHIRERIESLIAITRLKGLEGAYPGRLSGGESQRVAIARALANRPKLLLLDEPLSALDPSLRKSLRQELVEMQQALGITFLFVTHDQEEAMELADRMGILEGGRLLQAGTPAKLYENPASPFVAGFIGEGNRLTGTVIKQTANAVRIDFGEGLKLHALSLASWQAGERVSGFIRPPRLSFHAAGADLPEGGNRIPAVVRRTTFFGDHFLLVVEVEGGARLSVTHRPEAGASDGVLAGARGVLHIPEASLLLFRQDENGANREAGDAYAG